MTDVTRPDIDKIETEHQGWCAAHRDGHPQSCNVCMLLAWVRLLERT